MNKIIIIILFLLSSLIISSCTIQKADKINFQKAMETLDESYCDLIPSKVDPDRKSFRVKEILTTEDGRVIVSYSKERCYQYIAESKNDFSICKKIPPSGNIVNVCIINVAEFNNNVAVCEEFEGEDKQSYADTCYHNLAKKLNDPSLCNSIVQTQPLFSKQRCLQQFETD